MHVFVCICWCIQVNEMHDGRTLLHVAAAEGRLNAARVLLQHKADVAAPVSWIYISRCIYSSLCMLL